jgi:hypothetical protein
MVSVIDEVATASQAIEHDQHARVASSPACEDRYEQ